MVSPWRGTNVGVGVHDYPVSGTNAFHHATKWDMELEMLARVSVPVISVSAPGTILRPVWAESHSDLVSGNWQNLGGFVPLSERGFFDTPWQNIPTGAKAAGDVALSFVLEVESIVDMAIGCATIRLWSGASLPLAGNNLTFSFLPPGKLTLESGQYYGDWAVVPGNFGYTDAQVSTQIHSVLDDARGWERAGIIFREVSLVNAKVRFQVVEEATCGSPEWACTHYFTDYSYVELEHEPLTLPAAGWANLVNHESGHAFFGATHTGDGVMADFDNDRPEWPSDSEIQSVIDWLGA